MPYKNDNPYNSKNFQHLVDMCMKEYEVQKSQNVKRYKTNTDKYKLISTQSDSDSNSNTVKEDIGYIDVGVYTALGALPVSDALVTIYKTHEGKEYMITYFKTNTNGQSSIIEVPVIYNPDNPNMDPEYFYSTYNVRINAPGYYTVNLSDVQVFPKLTSLVNTSLIPLPEYSPINPPSNDIIIPPHYYVKPNAGGAQQ